MDAEPKNSEISQLAERHFCGGCVKRGSTVHRTIIFNVFVYMQIFNELNARKVNGELNVCANLFANGWWITIFIITFAGQIVLVEGVGRVSEHLFATHPLGIFPWAFTIACGLLSVVWTQILNWMPFALVLEQYPTLEKNLEGDELFQEVKRYNCLRCRQCEPQGCQGGCCFASLGGTFTLNQEAKIDEDIPLTDADIEPSQICHLCCIYPRPVILDKHFGMIPIPSHLQPESLWMKNKKEREDVLANKWAKEQAKWQEEFNRDKAHREKLLKMQDDPNFDIKQLE